MNNANRFLDAFIKIEQECYHIIEDGAYQRFYYLLNKAAKQNNILKRYEIELQDYGDLRNAIVHQRSHDGKIIAQPVDSVVERIEMIARLLTQPPLVGECFVKPVQSCQKHECIKDVYFKMKKLATSKMLIVENDQYKGLLTLQMISDYALSHDSDIKRATVKEVFSPNYEQEQVLFISKKNCVLDILEMFETGIHQGKAVIAILVSENGKSNEKVEGIITLADLPEVIRLVQD